jgi:hypothetical protein
VLSRLDPAGTNVVQVRGYCRENLVIRGFERLSLIAEPGAVIEDASSGQLAVVEIWDSQNVVVQGFMIQGGNNGLFCRDFSFCRFIGVTVEGTKAGAGIVIGVSGGRLTDAIVRDTADAGIQLGTAKVVAINVSITDTGGVGLAMQNASLVAAGDVPFKIQRAKGHGVFAANASYLTGQLTVTDSEGYGVLLQLGSTASLGPGNVTNNHSGGIFVQFQSSAVIDGTTVTNNQNFGLLIDQVSYALVMSGSFSGHSWGDIVCGPQVAEANVVPGTQYNSLLCPIPPASALSRLRR